MSMYSGLGIVTLLTPASSLSYCHMKTVQDNVISLQLLCKITASLTLKLNSLWPASDKQLFLISGFNP